MNYKAVRVGAELYGFMFCDYRCSSHSIDGCWKRFAHSETMCVEEAKFLNNNLKAVVKHFKFRGKSKEILDNSMKALEMGSVHILNWCATRMAYFAVACQWFDELLIPVYNSIYTLDLKKEKWDMLFQSRNIYTMKLISDLHGLKGIGGGPGQKFQFLLF